MALIAAYAAGVVAPQSAAGWAQPGAYGAQRLYVEPKRGRTFGPVQQIPAGTEFFISILHKAPNNAFRLHRCREACGSGVPIAVWRPEDYAEGDELSWRVTAAGNYYLWNQDPHSDAPMVAVSYEFTGSHLRITYDSGTVIEAWYVVP